MVDNYVHVKHCTTHPKFLHSNSTSHRWVFGAIAELIDNAIDPDVNASQFCIDMKEFNGEPCLVFMDNGSGLVPEKVHKMLSFGHSKKQMTPGDRSIGKHGNGFKSGTMRLGKDVLVLTKCADSMTAGFLSQTFLADTKAEDILIPQYSIFPDEESLLAQLDAIPNTGAILIISNLRRHEGVLELDFDTDPHDIRISSDIASAPYFQQLRPSQPNSTVVPMDYSLRAYLSILYKIPRMQIFIRDKKVKTKRIAGLLSQRETEIYKPYGVAESIKIELGFNTENKNLYGMMLYHRNRLIKAYMRVGMQLEENERGMGVIGLVEADFLQPTHNKQDFDDTTAYRRLLKKLADVLAEYWWEKKERVTALLLQQEGRRKGSAGAHAEDVPDINWVQCDNPTCLKWRVLPPGTAVEKLPDIWYCEYHPDPKYRRHDEPEQEWDTTVQHEITERRRERKREYDREKKEREAEKKRQRLEAVARESVAQLERQKEELFKGIQEQLERERQAVEEKKRREEEVKKLNEEWALIKEDCARMESQREEMLNKQKELERQLTAAQEELARKAEEKLEFARLQAQIEAERAAQLEAEKAARIRAEKAAQLEAERLARLEREVERERAAEREAEKEAAMRAEARLHRQSQDQTQPPEENGHVPATDGTSSKGKRRKSESSRDKRGTSLKEKQRSHKGTVPVSTIQLPQLSSDVTQTHQINEVNGAHQNQGPEQCRMSPTSPSSAAQTQKPMQVSPPPSHDKSAAPAREEVERVPTVNQGHCSGTGLPEENRFQLTPPGRSRKQGRPVRTSQPPVFKCCPSDHTPPPNSAQKTKRRERIRNGEVSSSATQDVQSSSIELNQAAEVNVFENRKTGSRKRQIEVSSPSVDQRSIAVPDPGPQHQIAEMDTNGPFIGSLVSTAQQLPIVSGNAGNDAPAAQLVNDSARSAGPDEQILASYPSPGRLCIDLPMDASRSGSVRTLDKEFYSSQRRLRLALNTLAKIGGLNDGRVYDLDQLPITDDEVIELCEKTQESVESRIAKYMQDVTSLKAELAFVMADKYQHDQGRGWNFKIQSVVNKSGVVEVSKKT
ncbi:hypothetical protein R1sor_003452 [Riccia sorocarpa]|uniref:CW-type domain-containing protein n=1 Tax=Riccia sorocarpa TaxID=122646 RepID=A0ABD3H510_9MARC